MTEKTKKIHIELKSGEKRHHILRRTLAGSGALSEGRPSPNYRQRRRSQILKGIP